jgi:hypothetical protein
MVKTNRWDPAVLERFRADLMVQGFDAGRSTGRRRRRSSSISSPPDEWLAPAARHARQCAAAVRRQHSAPTPSCTGHA